MITEKTVFVLGAGASSPYGYPTGKGLIQEVVKHCVSVEVLSTCLIRREWGLDKGREDLSSLAHRFQHDLQTGQPDSIDSYLQRRREYTAIGKVAIASAIRQCNGSYAANLQQAEADQKNWYAYLKNKLFGETYEETCKKNNVSFVTFNYDTSLEKYFIDTLLSNFNIGQADEFFKKIKIIHAHGRLNKLPWEPGDLESVTTGLSAATTSVVQTELPFHFGGQVHHVNETLIRELSGMAGGIRLFHEDGEGEVLGEIKSLIKDAHQIFFLGFGFHPDNVKKLIPPHLYNPPLDGKRLFSTRFNCTDSEWSYICSLTKLRFLADGNTDCYNFLRQTAQYLR